jgi:hypothetical protein
LPPYWRCEVNVTRRDVLVGLVSLVAAGARGGAVQVRGASIFEAPFIAETLVRGTVIQRRVEGARIWIRADESLLGWIPASSHAAPTRIASVSRCPAGRLVLHVI